MSISGRESPTRSSNGGKGFMLFGVRVEVTALESPFRKCASMTNLAQFEHRSHDSAADVNAGYASDDVVHPSAGSRQRKRGVAWSEEEHRLFLMGLEKVGKGDWRGISRNFVKSRTPTQVASHAQKYFLRRNNQARRRRRSSLFDITTHDNHNVLGALKLEEKNNGLDKFPASVFPMSAKPVLPPPPAVVSGETSIKNSTKAIIRPTLADLNLLDKMTIAEPLPLSLNLPSPTSPSLPPEQKSPPGKHTSSAFQAMSSGSFSSSGGDSIISVA